MNLGVVLHSPLLKLEDRFFIKEHLNDFLNQRIPPRYDQILIQAPVRSFETPENRFQEEALDPDRVQVVGTPEARSYSPWSAWRLLSDIIRVIRRSSHLLVFTPSWRAIASSFLAAMLHRPFALYIGGDLGGGRPFRAPVKRLRRWLHLAAARRASFCLCAGPELLEITLRVQPHSFPVVPLVRLSPGDVPPERTLFIGNPIRGLYVGSLNPAKHVDLLIQAIPEIEAQTSRRFHLTIVGPGDPGALKQIATELGLTDRISLCGYLSNGPRLYEKYQTADAFLLASESEGFPRVFYEAFCFGLPVVTTPVGGIPKALVDGREALFFPQGSSSELARQVARLARNPQLVRTLLQGGHRFAREALRCGGANQMNELMIRHWGIGSSR